MHQKPEVEKIRESPCRSPFRRRRPLLPRPHGSYLWEWRGPRDLPSGRRLSPGPLPLLRRIHSRLPRLRKSSQFRRRKRGLTRSVTPRLILSSTRRHMVPVA